MERMVIFNLHFRMEAGDEELVVMWDDIIGPRLWWEDVTSAMALAKQEDEVCSGPWSLSWEIGPAYEDEDIVLPFPKSTAGDLDGDVECQAVKTKVDWTLALEEIRAKRQHCNKC